MGTLFGGGGLVVVCLGIECLIGRFFNFNAKPFTTHMDESTTALGGGMLPILFIFIVQRGGTLCDGDGLDKFLVIFNASRNILELKNDFQSGKRSVRVQ